MKFGLPLLVAFCLFLSACSKPAPEPIRVGLNPWPGYEFLTYAQEMGYFEQLGLAVEIVELTSLGDCRRAFERGQIDVMASTVVEAILVHEQPEIQAAVFYLCDYSDGSDKIIARSGIDSVAELKGKKIGYEPGALDIILINAALHAGSLKLDEVELVAIPQLGLPEAFREGRIDAAPSYPPVSISILQQEDTHVIYDSSQSPGLIADVFTARRAFIEQRAEELGRFILAYDRAVEHAMGNRQSAFALMAERQRISPAEFAEAIEAIKIVRLKEQAPHVGGRGIKELAIQNALEALKDAGSFELPIESSELLNLKPLRHTQ